LRLAHQTGLPPTATVRGEFIEAYPAIRDAVKEIHISEEKGPN
jgi:hypothetical protein